MQEQQKQIPVIGVSEIVLSISGDIQGVDSEALDDLLGLIETALEACDPQDLVAVVDEILERSEFDELRRRLNPTSEQQAAVLRDLNVPHPPEDVEDRDDLREFAQLGHHSLRLRFLLLGVYASRAGKIDQAGRAPVMSGFDIPQLGKWPASLLSGIFAAQRLDVLVPAMLLVKDDRIASDELASAIVRTAIDSLRKFLAFQLYLVETYSDQNARVGFDVLAEEHRLKPGQIDSEVIALARLRDGIPREEAE